MAVMSLRLSVLMQGRIQNFKLGGGGAHKKIAPSGGRREQFAPPPLDPPL